MRRAWKQEFLAADTLLCLLRLGLARFDPNTREFCFNGLRYGTRGNDWYGLVKFIGEDKIAAACLERATKPLSGGGR